MRPAIAWEKWIGKKGDGRRRAVRMVTIPEEHFNELLDLDGEARFGYYVQAKSRQSLSLYVMMEGLVNWMKEKQNG
jgi:hypothetical protein